REEIPASGPEASRPQPGRQEGPEGRVEEVPDGREGGGHRNCEEGIRRRRQEAGQGRGPQGDSPEQGGSGQVAIGPATGTEAGGQITADRANRTKGTDRTT